MIYIDYQQRLLHISLYDHVWQDICLYKQERLQEIPTSTNRVSNESIYEGGSEPALPGSEFDHHPHASSQVLSISFFLFFAKQVLSI